MESAGNQKNLEELHALKALLTQKDQYLKTLETTVKSKVAVVQNIAILSNKLHLNLHTQPPPCEYSRGCTTSLSRTSCW